MLLSAVLLIIIIVTFIISLYGFIQEKRKSKISLPELFSKEKMNTYLTLLIVSSAILGMIIIGFIVLYVFLIMAVAHM